MIGILLHVRPEALLHAVTQRVIPRKKKDEPVRIRAARVSHEAKAFMFVLCVRRPCCLPVLACLED